MNALAEKFAEWAKNSGWNVEPASEKTDLPEDAVKRYAFIPDIWRDFICRFNVISNAEDNIWFRTPYDIADDNDFENISLEAAEGDEEWQNNVRGFWDNHIPIVMSVAGDYHYYAIGVKTGEIFEGWEPEFEDPSICAPDFTSFIEHIISGKIILN